MKKEMHIRRLTAVLDAAIATGIPEDDLPPLLCAVAGMLLGEICARSGDRDWPFAAASKMDEGVMLAALTMRVTAKMAAKLGNRDDVFRELRRTIGH